jgi:hypothetical protein
MNFFSRALFRFARFVAGRDRSEWMDAMAGEAGAIEGDSSSWALGCVWAAMKERLRAERWFLGAITGLPVAAIVLQQLLFFPIFFGSQALGLPAETFVWIFLCLGFPLGFILGRRMRPGRALAAAFLCGAMLAWLNVVFFWILFGQGPEIWFKGNAHVYDMTPILGWSVNTILWVAGAGIAVLTRRSPPDRVSG